MKSPETTNVKIDLGPILEVWNQPRPQPARPEGAWTLEEFAQAAKVSKKKAENMIQLAIGRGVVVCLAEKGYHNRKLYRNAPQPGA